MRHNRKAMWSLCAAIFIFNASASAEETTSLSDELKEQRHLVELGLFLGGFFPHNDHQYYVRELENFAPLNNAFEIGLRAGYLPIPYLGAELEASLMPASTTTDKSALLYSVRAHLLAQYPARIAPFLVAGLGSIGVMSDDDALGHDVDLAPYFGVGAKFYTTRWLVLRLDGRLDLGTDTLDDNTVAHFEVLAGASFILGWEKPEPPPQEEPKEMPVLRDSDNDGITDDEDKCPQEPGIRPDGCPPKDTDNDGITDDKDKCPTEPGVPPLGCPPKDSDNDGIIDEKDQCPQEPETKNGYLDKDGCPDVLPTAMKKFTGAIQGITFDLNKDTIKATSFSTLDQAVSVLKEFEDLKLMIRGHSDGQGKREYNVDLSQRRANSVMNYMVQKGIAADRFKTEGLGPDEPIADNKTAQGRAKNRRIEFKVIVE